MAPSVNQIKYFIQKNKLKFFVVSCLFKAILVAVVFISAGEFAPSNLLRTKREVGFDDIYKGDFFYFKF